MKEEWNGIGKRILKKDPHGCTTVDIEQAHDDFYMYMRISGAYFMLFSYLVGFLSGIGAVLLLMHLFG